MAQQVHWRAKVAYMYTISQMLIYTTYSTYHNTKTTTIRYAKEHETPFLLYQGLNMHGDARLRKKQETVNVAELECKCEGGCMNNDNT